jgi:pimeloyl-ACP methyl ester carboxylesterase
MSRTVGPGGDLHRTDSPTAPLDREDSRVEAARRAEARAYEEYGLDVTEHLVDVPTLGLCIRVVEIGVGPPVVVIPGGVGYGVVWMPLLPELDGYRLLVMDRPGGGLSDGVDYSSTSLSTIATESTAALFDHFELDDAPIVGSSMGGLWTLRFALAHPERVSAIALLGCPALYPETSAPFPMRLVTLPVIGKVLAAAVLQANDADDARETWGVLGHPDETTDGHSRAFAEAWHRMDQIPHCTRSWVGLLRRAIRLRGAVPEAAFTPADLQHVRQPVLVLWGSDDPFGTIEQGRRGAAHLPDAVFYEVGVGHLPWLDDPATCGELLCDFLDRHG